MPSASDQNKPGQSETFEERIDMLFEELSFAFQRQRPSILLVFYESESVRNRAERALEKRLAENGHPLVSFGVDAGHYDIPLLLSQRPERESSVFSVTGLSRGGGKEAANAYRALNIRREYFVDHAIRVVIWLDRNEAMALSRHAPDFWAFRHRVVEFNDPLEPESPPPSAGACGQAAQGPDVDAGRTQQRFAESAVEIGRFAVQIQAGLVEEDLTHQRVAVGVKARRAQAEQDVAGFKGAATYEPVLVDHAHAETG